MLFILDKKMNPVGVANPESPKGLPYFNDIHHEALENNLNVLEFDVPANNPLSSIIEEEGYIIYTDMDYRQQLFVVKKIHESYADDSMETVSCEHASTGDLVNCFVKPATLSSYTLKQAMEYVLSTSDWNLGYFSDLGIQDVTFDKYTSVKEALNTISSQYGAELEYEVFFDGSTVKEKRVHAVDKRGLPTGVTLEVTKDITEIEREVNTDELITAVYAVGKDGLTLINLPDQNDPRYRITEDFIEDLEAFQEYSYNGRHKFGLYEDDSSNAIELFNNARNYLKENNTPKFTYNVSMVTLERLTGYSHKAVRIGDTIMVKDFKNRPNEPLLLEARVVDVKRSKTDPTADEVLLGEYNPISFAQPSDVARLQGVIEVTEKQVAEVRDATTPDAIKDVVITSQDFQAIIDNKADSKQLEDYVQTLDLNKKVEEINQSVDEKIEDIDFTPYARKVDVEQTASELDFKFSSSGGVNITKNSVGYAGTDFWEVTLDEDAYGDPIGEVTTTHSSDLEEFGVGSGFVLKGATLRQTVTVTQQAYTLSAIVKKGASGIGWLKVYDGQEAHVQNFTVNNAVDYQKYQLTFTPSANSVIVEIYGDIASEIIFTGLMFNIGSVALQWQHSAGEVYNTNVLMDMNGIRVVSNQYEGYTAITPEEFAGYAESFNQDTGTTEMKRVFTLNKDVTEVAKLDAEQEINMTPIKIVPVNSTATEGWAFVKE